MSDKLSRRNFIKLSAGIATSAAIAKPDEPNYGDILVELVNKPDNEEYADTVIIEGGDSFAVVIQAATKDGVTGWQIVEATEA